MYARRIGDKNKFILNYKLTCIMFRYKTLLAAIKKNDQNRMAPIYESHECQIVDI